MSDDLVSVQMSQPMCIMWTKDIKHLCDRIEELEAERDALAEKLAKVVELLEAWLELSGHCSIEEGVCCCGEDMENHSNPMNCGHSPVDHGAYVASHLVERTLASLTETPHD